MKPVLYRYKDSESVIKHMDGYTPGEGWEPLYSHDQVDQLQAQLVRQQKSYEAEIKVEIDSALERAAVACEVIENERWALYKGRPPYTGTEPGRADNYVFPAGMPDACEHGDQGCTDIIKRDKTNALLPDNA